MGLFLFLSNLDLNSLTREDVSIEAHALIRECNLSEVPSPRQPGPGKSRHFPVHYPLWCSALTDYGDYASSSCQNTTLLHSRRPKNLISHNPLTHISACVGRLVTHRRGRQRQDTLWHGLLGQNALCNPSNPQDQRSRACLDLIRIPSS